MKYPQLVPDVVCTTPVHIMLNSEDLDRYGQPVEALNLDTACNYQCTSQRTIEDKQIVIKTVATLLLMVISFQSLKKSRQERLKYQAKLDRLKKVQRFAIQMER